MGNPITCIKYCSMEGSSYPRSKYMEPDARVSYRSYELITCFVVPTQWSIVLQPRSGASFVPRPHPALNAGCALGTKQQHMEHAHLYMGPY